MIKYNEVEEIKNLIKSGFDIELISFELDMPIEELRKIKKELEQEQKREYKAKEIIDKKNKNAYLKMKQMRERYNKLYLKNNTVEVKKAKELSEEEQKIVKSVIANIKEIMSTMSEQDKKERRENAFLILTELQKIEQYQLTIEQAEKIHFLIESEELENLSSSTEKKIDFFVNKVRRKINGKLAEAVDIAQYQTEDVEELKQLKRKLTIKMLQNNPIVVGTVRSRIENKIVQINQQKVMDRMRNDVPTKIENIIKDIAQGTLDIQKSEKVIEEEAKTRVESKAKTKFSLTEEQEKRQILIQIRTALIEKAKQYYIENPETTIMQIQELYGGELEQAMRTVIENLLRVKDFERAKEVCYKFSSEDKESTRAKNITLFRNDIRNAEISDMILKGINMHGTSEEEARYFELIEKGLKVGKVKLGRISLGKSKDGSRNITLADIWTNGKENVK